MQDAQDTQVTQVTQVTRDPQLFRTQEEGSCEDWNDRYSSSANLGRDRLADWRPVPALRIQQGEESNLNKSVKTTSSSAIGVVDKKEKSCGAHPVLHVVYDQQLHHPHSHQRHPHHRSDEEKKVKEQKLTKTIVLINHDIVV